jgi:hypothetical protein
LENKFQVPPLKRGAIEINILIALHGEVYTATALIAL